MALHNRRGSVRRGSMLEVVTTLLNSSDYESVVSFLSLVDDSHQE